MVKDNEILILNTGGTFNKYYDPILGELIVKQDNTFVEDILEKSKFSNVSIDGILYKDSLEMDDENRDSLEQYIQECDYKKIIIIHGTDTMNKSARQISKKTINKTLVFTGAMVPYSVQNVEAVSNLMCAYGFLKATQKKGIYICMHGLVQEHNTVVKNRQLGIFECQK